MQEISVCNDQIINHGVQNEDERTATEKSSLEKHYHNAIYIFETFFNSSCNNFE